MTTTANTPATIPADARVRVVFDKSPCSRCGGRGSYSYGTCFKCGGAKTTTTRLGLAAWKRYTAWRRSTLALPLDETSVGKLAYIPQQFAGFGGMGGQFTNFPHPRRIVSIVRAENPTQGYAVTFAINLGASPRPWLRYNPEAKELTVQVFPAQEVETTNDAIFRAPTGDELRAIVPTLGKGARLEIIPAVEVAA